MRIPMLFVAAVLVSGCGTSRVDALEKQVLDLTQQLRQVQKAHASVSVNVEDLEARLFLVQDELDTYRQRARRHTTLPTVRVRRQPGPTAHYDPRDTRPVRRADPTVKGFDQLTEDGRKVSDGKEPRQVKPAHPVQPAAPRLSKNERDAISLYRESYAHYKGGRFQKAIDGFMAFVDQFPNHGHADNAVYWMGECYYTRALWKKALATFNQVIATYPLGNKAPDAMFKVGLCYLQIGNSAQAREVLEQVVGMYPDSPVAKLAQTQLDRIP